MVCAWLYCCLKYQMLLLLTLGKFSISCPRWTPYVAGCIRCKNVNFLSFSYVRKNNRYSFSNVFLCGFVLYNSGHVVLHLFHYSFFFSEQIFSCFMWNFTLGFILFEMIFPRRVCLESTYYIQIRKNQSRETVSPNDNKCEIWLLKQFLIWASEISKFKSSKFAFQIVRTEVILIFVLLLFNLEIIFVQLTK